MTTFTIEATYRIPIYRQRSYQAQTLTDACRLAIEDDDWEGQKEDYEFAGETYVTGAWPGGVPPYSVPARREGVIAYIDRTAPDGHEPVIEDVEFDDDRIHGPPAT